MILRLYQTIIYAFSVIGSRVAHQIPDEILNNQELKDAISQAKRMVQDHNHLWVSLKALIKELS